ncbi:MAG: ferritin [Candidatus Melainabacteria bacterium GWF2_37_15]|nr:MAG: ferritin [Candidatus Melainabacteria bacterium GWF2_37_15]
MLNQRLEKELNKQLNKELFSAYLYMSMGAYFQSVDLLGFANWMNIQVQEELAHAQKFYDFINGRNGRVVLEAIEKPQTDWDSALTAFQDALKHEQFITGSINDLVTISTEEKDYATQIFLQWFVTEQVEEESSVTEVTNKLKLMKDAPGGMFMLDRELGLRQLTAPSAN